MIDLVCPTCGSEELEVLTTVITVQPIRLQQDENGSCHADYPFSAEIDWDSGTETGVQCAACGWDHPGADYRSVLAPANDPDDTSHPCERCGDPVEDEEDELCSECEDYNRSRVVL